MKSLIIEHFKTLLFKQWRFKNALKSCSKIFFILLTFNTITVYSQNFSNVISLQYKNIPIEKVLNALSSQCNIGFSYNKNDLPVEQKISIFFNNKNLKNALDLIFKNTGIEYSIIGNQVALKKSNHHFTKKQEHQKNQKTLSDKSLFTTPLIDGVPIKKGNSLRVIIPKITSYKPVNIPKTNDPIYQNSYFQVSLVPGIGTNGIDGGSYKNTVSFNIFSGYSTGNNLLEAGGLSNFNTNYTTGLQAAGLANVTGGNSLFKLSVKDQKKIRKEGYNFDLSGLQIAGLLNIVRGNVSGSQIGGAGNTAFNSLAGLQAGGMYNAVTNFSSGVQLAGGWNFTGKSISGFQIAGGANFSVKAVVGVQIAALFNYTNGRLNGSQIGLFNFSNKINGKHSKLSSKYSGLQLGIFNLTKKNMDGVQIGLLNYSSDMKGTQIGIINFSRGKQRYPFGLLNINDSEYGYIRIYTNELFLQNYELATGSKKVTNTISYSRNAQHMVNDGKPQSAFGYALGKLLYTGPFFFNGDIQLMHINKSKGITKELSLLTKIRGSFGFSPFMRTSLQDIYLFVSASTNHYLSKTKLLIGPEKLRLSERSVNSKNLETWIGFAFGVNIGIGQKTNLF